MDKSLLADAPLPSRHTGATLTFQDVTYEVNTKAGRKTILGGVSGIARPGQVGLLALHHATCY